jgi:hypothetical protein
MEHFQRFRAESGSSQRLKDKNYQHSTMSNDVLVVVPTFIKRKNEVRGRRYSPPAPKFMSSGGAEANPKLISTAPPFRDVVARYPILRAADLLARIELELPVGWKIGDV